MALVGCGPVAAQPRRVGFGWLDAERVAGATEVTSPNAGALSQLSVVVVIDADGHVIDATVDDNFEKLDLAPGLAAVRAWRFRPQRFEGVPVVAVGRVSVDYVPPAEAPDARAGFPAGDAATTEITLERSACFGSCPDYRVTVRGDGLVRFSTRDDIFPDKAGAVHRRYNGQGVLLPGVHETRVAPAAAVALIQQFRNAHFFGLKPAYEAAITDNPTYSLTVRIGAVRRTVRDYVGRAVGMPASVTALENAIDRVAGTRRWVDGDGDTVSWLASEHFDFRSTDAAELAVAVVAPGRTNKQAAALLVELIARGLPLDARIGRRTGGTPVGSLLVGWAARQGKQALFDRLVTLGALRRASHDDLQQAFTAGAGCSPAIARALVGAGADPKANKLGSPLIAIRERYGPCEGKGEAALVAMADTLIDLGVPLEARDPTIGWTALMGCDSPELARLLLARGADPNAHDKDGTTPLLGTDDDRVALLLLRAGANPRVKDENGTVRQQAFKQHMPATLAWLDEHGIQ